MRAAAEMDSGGRDPETRIDVPFSRMTRRAVALACALLLVTVTACGGDDDDDEVGADDTTTTEAPTTTADTEPELDQSQASPPADDEDGDPEVASTCGPGPAVPGSATDVTTAPVDWDGDGTDDVLTVYQDGGSWYAHAQLAGADVADVVLSGSGPSMKAVGGATLDQIVGEEAWVNVGSGSATAILSVLAFVSCQLHQATFSGTTADFAVGVTVTAADGVTCFDLDAGIEDYSSTSTDGVTYTGQSDLYTLDVSTSPPSLVHQQTTPQSATTSDPLFSAMSGFICDELDQSHL